jgi:coproporphyrinogen III oxidase
MFNEAKNWFESLRDELVKQTQVFEKRSFNEKRWNHRDDGGGLMTKIKGSIIEKGGINISTVSGKFNEKMQKNVLGASEDPKFSATGISVVLHPMSPHIPSMHFNTRYLTTTKSWFGGGMDLTPCLDFEDESQFFHKELEHICNKYDTNYYPKYKKWCDEYFYLKHRKEPRGIGGIFFDHLNSGNQKNDFEFVKDVGNFFLKHALRLINNNKDKVWTSNEKDAQLIKRGRYVEFNLLYDRGTKFGLETGGNTDAILMSMPPVANWE